MPKSFNHPNVSKQKNDGSGNPKKSVKYLVTSILNPSGDPDAVPRRFHRRTIRLQGFDYSRKLSYFITICTYKKRPLFGTIRNGKMILNNAGRIVQQCWDEIPRHFPHVQTDKCVIMPDHVHGIITIQKHVPPSRTMRNHIKSRQLSTRKPGNRNPADNAYNIGVIRRTNDDGIHTNGTNGTDDACNIGGIHRTNIIHHHIDGRDGIDDACNIGVGAKNFSPLPTGSSPPSQSVTGSSPPSKSVTGSSPPSKSVIGSSPPSQSVPGTSRTIGSVVRGFKIGVTKWMRQNTNVHNVWQRNYYECVIREPVKLNSIRRYIENNPEKWSRNRKKSIEPHC